ncbi:general secretion pathway protein GspB [Pseudoalteromonas tunicata]|uniref:general secretion pathway protein GspB n=1 Tax=Pseudoalteromonas tunicata TaxID=314281 RepID=UPI00273D3DE0|nr:general secretion pathway protein GspB [Pseudoalteromonas tunicata]MDP5214406.1 general secretion pathway protein GspB [Pseudoalteromonas tunicata]
MSYLLDALKQENQKSGAASANVGMAAQLHYSEQQSLKFYRRLVLVLALVLALIVGFLSGKWYQSYQYEQGALKLAQDTDNLPPAQVEASPVNPVIAAPAIEAKTIVEKNDAEPKLTNTLETQNDSSAADEIDYSQYKVVGKPLDLTAQKAQDAELNAVPDELKAAFAKAVAQTEKLTEYEVTQGSQSSSLVQPIELLPDVIAKQIPPMSYQAHIYATDAKKRWIKLNNRSLYEGDTLSGMTVLEIAPEQTVMSMDGYKFSLSALQDWRK